MTGVYVRDQSYMYSLSLVKVTFVVVVVVADQNVSVHRRLYHLVARCL